MNANGVPKCRLEFQRIQESARLILSQMWLRNEGALVVKVRKLESARENLSSEKPRVVGSRERRNEMELGLRPTLMRTVLDERNWAIFVCGEKSLIYANGNGPKSLNQIRSSVFGSNAERFFRPNPFETAERFWSSDSQYT